ncbi:hypothetical protein OCGS_2767 [Oceaniovalibus guishaninsula JLT2003]|uniref:Uncharacterized protein n=1 Tax=Oceaniovalibus guishaninsula JLT2003 TaxID=1231392 RepID=K2GKC4_9RHOB|nr:RidA family protein [Oceaniovalibus guishaninsula]EKE43176.1 hypothetical protein OCGS_2767 [Oceaniovalibus guishaninsula JLT2003]
MSGTPHDILQPDGWASAIGYANGVVAEGRQVFLGGLVGWDAQQQWQTDDLVGQVDRILASIVTLLAEAGGRPEHLVRLTWYIVDKRDYLANAREIGRAYRRHLGKHFPAMALVQVADLLEDRAKVEIEATAVIPAEERGQ